MPKIAVPITPAVLDWAISDSGFSVEQIAEEAGVQLADLNDWLSAKSQPGVTEVRALVQALRRPVAALLLPKPPDSRTPAVGFRHTPGVAGRSLSPKERRYLRKAARLQAMLVAMAVEMGEAGPRLPQLDTSGDAGAAAAQLRPALALAGSDHPQWASASAAFDAWRESVEGLGVAVFLFQLGPENCRGFSLWNDTVPVIAVNTAWNDEARTFTLLHELGHLVARTDSACAAGEPAELSGAWDPVERWCEVFAAALLIPEEALRVAIADRLGPGVSRVVEVAQVRRLASRFRSSSRATTIRLIELGLASWELYRQLPAATDAKSAGGGGKGRDRQEIQEDSLGARTADLFRRAVNADVVTRSEALTYLDVPDSALDLFSARPA